MHWFFDGLKKFAQFNGRAGREEFWMFQLVHLIITSILIVVLFFFMNYQNFTQTSWLVGLGVLYMYGISVFLPNLGLMVRRLHDIGKSGWWCLLSLIPLVGILWLVVLLIADSQPGANPYGPSPKGLPQLPVEQL